MMSIDAVFPAIGGISTLVIFAWVVSAATAGSVVAVGAGTDAEGLAEAEALAAGLAEAELADGLELTVLGAGADDAGLGAALDAGAAVDAAGLDGVTAAEPPHAASSSTATALVVVGNHDLRMISSRFPSS